jgi:hypothetical protein
MGQLRLLVRSSGWALVVTHRTGITDLIGPEALRAAALLIPAFNFRGGTSRQISEAIELTSGAKEPEALFTSAAALLKTSGLSWFSDLPAVHRLALEMAAHEDIERIHLEAELRYLVLAWREAEEIASIADSLLDDASVAAPRDKPSVGR